MKQIFKFSALALILAISFSSCKKYEDGLGFSLRSKKGRLCGDWKIKSINLDGKDQFISDDRKDDTWKILKDQKVEYVDPGDDTQKRYLEV